MEEYEMEDNPICRICMAANARFISIVDVGGFNEPALHEMISECTRYKVELDDVLPRNVCLKCAEDVRIAYRFKKRAEDSYKELCFLFYKEVKGEILRHDVHNVKINNPIEQHTEQTLQNQGCQRECHLCGKSFDRLCHLNSHMIEVHPKPSISKNFQCHNCKKRFSRKHHLKRHLRNVHKIDIKSSINSAALGAPVKDLMDFDDMIKYPKGNVKNEEYNEDIEIKPLGGSFSSIQDKIKEEKYVTENRESFALSAYKRDNIKNCAEFAGQSQSIEIKNAVLSDERYVSKIDDTDTKTQSNQCNKCRRVYARRCHLQRHLKSAHTNERPHVCKHCHKRFTRRDHLKTHEINVHEIKGNKCSMCERAFVKYEDLQRHKESQHPNESNASCDIYKTNFDEGTLDGNKNHCNLYERSYVPFHQSTFAYTSTPCYKI